MKKPRLSVIMLLVLLLPFSGCGNASSHRGSEDETTTNMPSSIAESASLTAEDTTAESTISETVPTTETTVTVLQTETIAVPQTETTVTSAPQTLPPETTAAPTDAPTETTAAPTQENAARTVTTNSGNVLELSSLTHCTEAENAPTVYFTKEISADALLRIYEALPYALSGKIAVKLSTGESPASNYLRPELIGKLVQSLGASIAECMTAYGGVRSVAAMHKQAAADRGYTSIAAFDLLDEDGETEIPYAGARLDRAIVGSHLANYDGVLVLSHFKGHTLAGFGGAIKNVGIGMSGRTGKIYVHSAGTRTAGLILNADQLAWLEALAEATKAISDYEGNGSRMVYISVMNRLSVSCDCEALPLAPDMHDIGVLASTDPVALDQACVDLVYAVPDGHSLIQRMESHSGAHVLEYGEQIGLGSRTYRLIDIDS
ncbi:MAG: DUF362 domain-containing protein [Clostridia bacterium]|nr:DUF362 domain-containing protein [Clostridia bacterium]